jgi:FkbM family methyltransferase
MRFVRPEYIFRSSQIFRRIAFSLGFTRKISICLLPWKLPIKFDPNELHGRAVLTLGLSDLRTNELISRIVRQGDNCIDIGANIGMMTSLMARRADSSGHVFAFEPHPLTRSLLEVNTLLWSQSTVSTAQVDVLPYAVSAESGQAVLHEPTHFSENSGVASLETRVADDEQPSLAISVETITYDKWARDLGPVRLVKIDVEGHEDHVLLGMKNSLQNKKIDFLIFEEFRGLPSPATDFLEDFGYQCFLIDRSFWGPILKKVSDRPTSLVGEATNILALHQPEDLKSLTEPGWSCLR